MFITVLDYQKDNSEVILNSYIIQETHSTKNTINPKDTSNPYLVVLKCVSGKIYYEGYPTEEAAEERVNEISELVGGGGLIQVNSYDELPPKGNKGTIYLTKDTGQTYYWDETTLSYQKTGTSGRTGVYSYDGELSTIIGTDTQLNKSDLNILVAPTVPYSEGSEVVASNSVHGMIIGSTSTKVTVKTITDMTIDSFNQVATLADLPNVGTDNILYAVRDIKEFRAWDSVNSVWYAPAMVYSGIDNNQIHVSINANREVEATLQEHSVSEDYLTTELATKINNKVDKAVATDTSNKLVGAIATTQSGDNVIITKTKVDVTDNTSSTETTTITSSDDSIDLEVTSVAGGKQINLIGTTVTGVEAGLVDTTDPHNPVIQHDATKQNISDIKRFNNVFAFDGTEKTFTFPNTIDLDHLDHIFINGVLMEKGASNDYTINKTNRTITFTLAWEAKDKSYVTCE